MKSFLVSFLLLLGACGNIEGLAGKEATPAPTVAPTPESVVELQGSVQYAFGITVNDEKFNDIEDYYTSQAQTLKDRVVSAGYNADTVEFVGNLGFSDFIEDMTVFVSSSLGTQGKGRVDGNGNFDVSVPNPNNEEVVSFKIRANKRIQIILSRSGMVTNKLCYNFAAVEKDVIENPISLSVFTTDYTLYDCQQESDGMLIPESASAAAKEYTLTTRLGVKTVWVNGSNEFFVDTQDLFGNGKSRQKFVLSRVDNKPYAASEIVYFARDAEMTAPEGYEPFGEDYSVKGSYMPKASIPFDGEILMTHGNIDWTEVDIIRDGAERTSFFAGRWGLDYYSVVGNRIFAVGRVAGENAWEYGELDLNANRFVPRGDINLQFASNVTAGSIEGTYVVVAANTITFIQM